MRRPGHSPIRRNRNIGTAWSGYGKDNALVIPWACDDPRTHYERLPNPVFVPITVHSRAMTVVVEPPLDGFFYPCTVDDIERILGLIAEEHLEDLSMVVLRQPKRKERILSSVWGRMAYMVDIGTYEGPAVILESVASDLILRWRKSLAPDVAAELERLRLDGHEVSTTRRHHVITCSPDAVRHTVLYRTLPHEVGHHKHYLQSVVWPLRSAAAAGKGDEELADRLFDLYFAKPVREREDFAHRYAGEFLKRATSEGTIPFDRLLDARRMNEVTLDPAWFTPH